MGEGLRCMVALPLEVGLRLEEEKERGPFFRAQGLEFRV